MDIAQPITAARAGQATAPADAAVRAEPERARLTQECVPSSEAGTAPGINIAPGSNDDGWIVPEPVRLADGSRLQLYKDGEALKAGYRAIERARTRVCLEMYIFHDDDTGRAFAELLCKKASEGVRVYVLYDSFGSIGTDREMFERMRRSGVQVEEFHPIRPWEGRYSWRPFNRDHRKLLVVDDDQAGLGGLNVGAEYAGSWVIQPSKGPGECDFWRDTAIGVVGPSSRHFLRAFAKSWNYVQRGGRIRKAEYVYDICGAGAGDAEIGVLATVPTVSSPLRPFLTKLFRESRDSIDMTMAYFAPDDDLVAELCGAAKRGARVRLMLPGRIDVQALRWAARSFYEKLMSSGVEVYERQAAVLHAKSMVVDGYTSMVGSTNLDYRSIEYNLELSAIVRSSEFGRQMSMMFENDVKFAKRITLKEWRKRPMWDRFVQWAVSRARYLL
jgi:cardiolipin synthase